MLKQTLALRIALAATATAIAAQPASAQVFGHVGIDIGPPPPPRIERIPRPPGPGYAWRHGYWRWDGRRYVWAHGYYAHRPWGHAAWIRAHWVRGSDGRWYYRAGHWA